MSHKKKITKETIEDYFRELSKEIKKEFGRKIEVDLIIVGGASILLNYNFRSSTIDIDALIQKTYSIQDAIHRVGDRNGLPSDWINSDFKKTLSYSIKLAEHSKYYKTYNQVLNVRTISAEYLIAMKMVSHRRYKNDISDIIGIVMEQKELGKPIEYYKVINALEELYNDKVEVPESIKEEIKEIVESDDPYELYKNAKNSEKQIGDRLKEIDNKYENVINENNINNIINNIEKKKNNNPNMGKSR